MQEVDGNRIQQGGGNMPQKIIEKLLEKKADLIADRDKYNYEAEDREVEVNNNKLNECVSKRNSKKDLYDSYRIPIEKIDSTIENIKELIEVDEDSGIEHPIENGETE